MWKPTWPPIHREYFSIQQYLAFLLNDTCEKCGVNGNVVDPDPDPDPGGQKLPIKK
jgi:hypothetical protein